LNSGDEITFLDRHILAIHSSHNRDILSQLDESEWREFGRWLAERARG
jgi:hypothetical protein